MRHLLSNSRACTWAALIAPSILGVGGLSTACTTELPDAPESRPPAPIVSFNTSADTNMALDADTGDIGDVDTAGDADAQDAGDASSDTIDVDPLAAFEGFGADVTGGGGGGMSIMVTNTNEAGTGSLREAAEVATAARVIGFDVSGSIRLDSPILITSGDVTIDGSTAPSPGIVINGGFEITAPNVILRHLRIRPGLDGDAGTDAAIRLESGASDVVVDHCSVAWFGDEGFIANTGDMSDPLGNVTVSWSIFAEGLKDPGTMTDPCVPYGCDRGAVTVRGEMTSTTSIHHNLLMNNYAANPRVGGDGQFEVVNNVVSGWVEGLAVIPDTGSTGLDVDVIGNHYVNPLGSEFEVYPDTTNASVSIYLEDNLGPNRTNDDDPETAVMPSGNDGLVAASPHTSTGLTVHPAARVQQLVLDNAGATLPCRDVVDAAFVEAVRMGEAKNIEALSETMVDPSFNCAQ